jgi:molecular chaperone Hsp33
MIDVPAFLDSGRPDVPATVTPRGVTPFHLPGHPVRGRLIRLGALADALLTRHPHDDVVSQLTGQALSLVAALAGALKFRGSFSLQIKGDGPVRMLLADCTDTGELRGYAAADADRVAALLRDSPVPDAASLLGTGVLAFTVDQGPDMDRHQGIVTLEGRLLQDMALHYFDTSEQMPCFLRLACRHTPAGWRASALILERVAGQGGIDPQQDVVAQDEAWGTAIVLAGTVKDSELLDDGLAPERLLFNLFNDVSGEIAAELSRPLAYGCRCSRAKLAGILGTFGPGDITDMEEAGAITMTCEFCNLDFRFTRADIRLAAST